MKYLAGSSFRKSIDKLSLVDPPETLAHIGEETSSVAFHLLIGPGFQARGNLSIAGQDDIQHPRYVESLPNSSCPTDNEIASQMVRIIQTEIAGQTIMQRQIVANLSC